MSEEVSFLKILIRKGLIDEDEAKSYLRAFRLVRQRGQSTDLPSWLVKRGLLTGEQCLFLKQQLRARSKKVRKILPIDSQSDAPPRAIQSPPPPIRQSGRYGVLESQKRAADSHKRLMASKRRTMESQKRTTDSQKRTGDSRKRSDAKSKKSRTQRFGDYVIKREIARGGMGAVYEVTHPEFGGPLALKVLLKRGRSNTRQLKRFSREVETIQRLDHDGIITIVDAGTIDEIDYLTMEFIDGRPMDEVLAGKAFTDSQLIRIVRDLALALDHAHQHGVIHRDLKPANVLIRSESMKPVITDFGLAKDLLDSSVLSRTGTVIGTPRYLSPEQVMAQHDKISSTTDIYALGVILYEGLTGERPFDADSIESLYQKIEAQNPIHPCEIVENLSSDLADVCLKAMSKEQEDRYQSGTDFAKDLETYLRTGRVSVNAVPLLRRVERFVREKYEFATRYIPPKFLLGIGIGLVIILLILIPYMIFGGSPPPPTIPKDY